MQLTLEINSQNELQLIRAFAAESDAFTFWESEEEDLYQDFLPTAA